MLKRFFKSQWGAVFIGCSIGLILAFTIAIPAIEYWKLILK